MLHNLGLLFDAAWKVLAVGLLLGAGLPALFALGIRSMAYGVGGAAEIDTTASPHPVGRALGILCFALVAAAVLLGITIIVASGFGKSVSFEHIFPVLVDKH
ncbi:MULTISPECIES: hypothetical protein [Arsenicicoccus]|uniref:Transmembrane protein n=1 Tax=Arsenicicoccus bolidensis TaxID=229480 RepID=A0ABS9PXS4_9MICO|nr:MULTISPECIES: hypothetical protein [Arsenicicoccus]MCG7320304.1 hypothetical protein [Arsenicicoccus bolidensis]